MSTAVRSVIGAWRWLIGWFVVAWIVAMIAGAGVRAGVRAAPAEFVRPDDRILAAWLELLQLHPDIAVAAMSGWLASALIAASTTALIAPGLLVRLGGETRLSAVAARWASTLWPQLATTLWNWLLRVALLLAVVTSVGEFSAGLTAALLAAILLASTAALDIGRAAVVLHDAPGTSMRCTVAAFVALARHPKRAAVLVGLQLAAWAFAVLGFALTMRSAGEDIWPMRLAGLIAIGLGAVRLRLASDAGPLAVATGNP